MIGREGPFLGLNIKLLIVFGHVVESQSERMVRVGLKFVVGLFIS
jgi:hypothetical protein